MEFSNKAWLFLVSDEISAWSREEGWRIKLNDSLKIFQI
jgi:hypothetical protein